MTPKLKVFNTRRCGDPLKMCDVHFCDFIIWRNEELVIDRIEHNDNFLEKEIDKVTFFKFCILPELAITGATAT